MDEKTLEHIYMTLAGLMEEGHGYPGVENAFAPGSVCQIQSDRLYSLLVDRLDANGETLSAVLEAVDIMQRDIALRMFRLGRDSVN